MYTFAGVKFKITMGELKNSQTSFIAVEALYNTGF